MLVTILRFLWIFFSFFFIETIYFRLIMVELLFYVIWMKVNLKILLNLCQVQIIYLLFLFFVWFDETNTISNKKDIQKYSRESFFVSHSIFFESKIVCLFSYFGLCYLLGKYWSVFEIYLRYQINILFRIPSIVSTFMFFLNQHQQLQRALTTTKGTNRNHPNHSNGLTNKRPHPALLISLTNTL